MVQQPEQFVGEGSAKARIPPPRDPGLWGARGAEVGLACGRGVVPQLCAVVSSAVALLRRPAGGIACLRAFRTSSAQVIVAIPPLRHPSPLKTQTQA
jgi:hypothetical protein